MARFLRCTHPAPRPGSTLTGLEYAPTRSQAHNPFRCGGSPRCRRHPLHGLHRNGSGVSAFDLSLLCHEVLDAIPDSVIATDLNGIIVMVNARVTELLGHTRGSLIGKPIESLLPVPMRDRHAGLRRRYVRNPEPRPMADLGVVQAVRADGEAVPVLVSLAPLRTRHGHFIICSLRDASAVQEREMQLERLSTTDPMTELYNRGYFDAELLRVQVGRRMSVGIIVADIDGLKPVNDRFGHSAGDTMIRRTATVLRSVFRVEDIVARIGGDEFAVLLPHVTRGELLAAVERTREALRVHNEVALGRQLKLSVGGAWTDESSTVREVFMRADAAMYRNKEARRSDSYRARRKSM